MEWKDPSGLWTGLLIHTPRSDRLDPCGHLFQLTTFRPSGSYRSEPRCTCGVDLNYWMAAYEELPGEGNAGLIFQKRQNPSKSVRRSTWQVDE